MWAFDLALHMLLVSSVVARKHRAGAVDAAVCRHRTSSHPVDEPTPIMLLKTAHTGSTWLQALVNELPGVYMRREGIRRGAKSLSNDATVVYSYLRTALAVPAENIESNAWVVTKASGRSPVAVRDVSAYACAVGLSYSPILDTEQLIPNIDSTLDRLVDDLPGLVTVVLMRSNIAKMALAANGNGGNHNGTSVIKKVAQRPQALLKKMNILNKRAKKLRKVQKRLQKRGVDTITIFYEDMQQNVTAQVERIVDRLNMSRSVITPQKLDTGVTKQHSDSIKETLGEEAFNQVVEYFRTNAPCYLTHVQSVRPEKLPVCCSPTTQCQQQF